MEPNIYKITIDSTEYEFRVTPLIKTDNKISFQIEDLPPTTRFAIEFEPENGWVQISGNNKIDKKIIEEIGLVARKQYL